ncbi:COP9 signalosome complex subunit 3 isoform X1 [Bombyx mandarina]|uniref:COP9 signalosome complex subunit 3 n=4 Tax=Bombyx TaxID=7090 RepID=A0A8R2AN87_BOMMO|nr:COP9 signalosome complex subunit 3 isoform X1 [Bombyx mori]XP_028032825.1 COP9 signalosome complex subunit 3 isoform X1 [Bombyx mandarina]
MASPLEQFVNNVRTMSASGNFRDLYEIIAKSDEVLQRNSFHLNTVLETLDIQQHSLGVLAVLVAKFSLPPGNPEVDRSTMYQQFHDFINNCNGEQVRFATDLYADLCHLLTNHLVEIKQPIRGLEILKKAIRKIQLFDSQLTSIHADLCQLCLLSKCMKPALEFLDTDVTGIGNELGGINDSKHFLLYYYYGGMIYTAMKNYDRALYFFEVVVTVPAMVVSHIMLEAYKKYILVSLILHGKVLPMPKYTSQVVCRFLKPLSAPYHDLVASQHAASKHREIFVRDKNMGLVNQVLNSMYKKNIQRLTKTFLTLSLSDVASRVELSGPLQAETYILNMIEEGEIYAMINQKDGMVVFLDSPEKYASPETLCVLEQQMAACTKLHQYIQEMDVQIQVNPQYVKKSVGSHDEDMPGTSQNTKTTYTM